MLNSVAVIATSNITAVFAFGDSTVDSGNNNHIGTLFRSDHLPYRRDFPTHLPTGRFSNGKIATDFLAQILGIKDLLPAYLSPLVTDNDLITGVSFASGGSGFDPHTVELARVFGLSTQYGMFEQALERITRVHGDEKTTNIIRNALFVVSIGTNDMLYNAYLSPIRITPYGSISSYQDFMLRNLVAFIQRLYAAGARRILVAGLPPIGCLPIEMTISSMIPGQHWLERFCNVDQNMDSKGYNNKLRSQIRYLQTTLTDAKVAYFDIYNPILDMVRNPDKYGFVETVRACCGTGLFEMGPVCNIVELTCPDSSKYLFWDAVHLTEARKLLTCPEWSRN